MGRNDDPKDYKVQWESADKPDYFNVEYGTMTLTQAQRYCDRMNASYAGKRTYSYYDLTED